MQQQFMQNASRLFQQHTPQYANQPPPPSVPYPGNLKPSQASAVPTEPGTKVFVGQLPFSKQERDLYQLFQAIGPVAEVVLMRDAKTQQKKGSAFVRFHSAAHAERAVGALDGFTFSGSPRPIAVSIAAGGSANSQAQKRPHSATQGEMTIQSMGVQAEGALPVNPSQMAAGAVPQEGAKLFVGQLPFSRNEEEIKEVFSAYGQVAEVFLHRDASGQKKGGAFVRFFNTEDAIRAIELDGYLFPGATRPITVALAGSDGAKRRRTM
jgi:RNA recognition motif-containing protein